MTKSDIKNLIALFMEYEETNLESIQALEFLEDYSNGVDYLHEMIKNTESMRDILKIIERSLQN